MISPNPETFTSGDVKGTIWHFVVWEDDPSCPVAQCPGTQDVKRLIVSVRLDSTPVGGTRRYQELQAQLTDPAAQPVDNENPIDPGTDTTQPWTFWLTDTTCDHTTRQPIVADHLTHNTRGGCSTGMTTGNNPGAPDLMFNDPPPFDEEAPIFDYATDVEPTQSPGSDRGLQLVKEASNGCLSDATDVALAPDLTEPDRFQKVHKWVSPAIPDGFDVQLNGQGTLNLWTQTINAAVYPAKICVWLFVRQVSDLGVAVDTPVLNLRREPHLLHLLPAAVADELVLRSRSRSASRTTSTCCPGTGSGWRSRSSGKGPRAAASSSCTTSPASTAGSS